MTKKAIAIVSGGMDSVTLVAHLRNEGYDVEMICFNYGQRHSIELWHAMHIAVRFGIPHTVIDLSDLGSELSGSSLTDRSIPVPEGHYAAENMKQTVVPNRNAIMLSIAWGIAVARGAEVVATGIHAGDHAIYPDCREPFAKAFQKAMSLANEGFGNPDLKLSTPFVQKSKADIVTIGSELGVPFEMTWSCYNGGDIHCGRCGTCVERKEAFLLAKVEDPTVYVDREFGVEKLLKAKPQG